MGWTRFSGPVYGAKQTLFSGCFPTLSSGSGNGISTIAAATIVPVGEDWYATEFQIHRGSTGSSVNAFWVNDDATNVSSVTMTSTGANVNSISIITPDGGEKEGKRMASGSTITFNYSNSSAQGGLVNVNFQLSGYRRFVTSSRAE